MAFDPVSFGSGASGLLGGLFGGSDKPYKKAQKQYQRYADLAAQNQAPYQQAGHQALGNYQTWLQGQQDPSGFINQLLSKYQESPYTRYLQQQSQNAGVNAASASGLIGSTPFLQQQQQNAGNIAQQGIDSWLQNVLGINNNYGQGQQNLIQGGQNSANALGNIYGNLGNQMGEAAYGRQAGKQQDMFNTFGGLSSILAAFL